MQNLFPKRISLNLNLITIFFTRALIKEKLSQAYLILGENPELKLELCTELNKILNCEQNENELKPACGACQNCRWISENTHPSTPIILEGDSSSKKHIIKIEQIKVLQETLAKASQFKKLVIVKDASSKVLGKAPANSLLKTLEEAPSDTCFILFASNKEQVLPTIYSRCQILNMETNSSNSNTIEHTDRLDELTKRLYQAASRIDCMNISEELVKNYSREELISLLEELMKQQSQLLQDNQHPSTANSIQRIDQAIQDLEAFVRPRLALEHMLLDICNLPRI